MTAARHMSPYSDKTAFMVLSFIKNGFAGAILRFTCPLHTAYAVGIGTVMYAWRGSLEKL